MDSVIARIKSRLNSLTPNEAKIARYCLDDPNGIINNSIHGVAKETGVSVASVSRLASTLGYRDWKEMRLTLAKDSGGRDNPVYPDIARNDPDELVVEKVFNGNSLSIQNTLRQIDKAKVIAIARRIGKTDGVMFFGSGGSGYLAKDEALRFSHLKASVHACTEDYAMMLQAAKMKKGQIAFGFSHSGRSRATVEVLTEAQKCGALTVGIANFPGTPLEKVSDYFFQTFFPLGGGITAALTARASLLTIMDAIYVLAAQHGGMSDKVGYMDEVLENSLRVPVRKKGTRKK